MSSWIKALFSAIGVVGVAVSVIAYVLQVPYRAAIERSIGAKFDRDLENIRAEFRVQEEYLRAEIRKGERALEVLQNGALSNMVARKTTLYTKRAEAIEAMWQCVSARAKLKMGVLACQTLNVENLLKASKNSGQDGQNIKLFVKTAIGGNSIEDLAKLPNCSKYKIYIPSLLWAIWEAYTAVLIKPVVVASMVELGVGGDFLASPSVMNKMLKAVLPHQAEFIDQYPESAFAFLADELEELLLKKCREAVDGDEDDGNAIAQAAKITEAAKALRAQNAEVFAQPIL